MAEASAGANLTFARLMIQAWREYDENVGFSVSRRLSDPFVQLLCSRPYSHEGHVMTEIELEIVRILNENPTLTYEEAILTALASPPPNQGKPPGPSPCVGRARPRSVLRLARPSRRKAAARPVILEFPSPPQF